MRTVIIVMTIVYVATQFITQRQMILKNSAPDNPMVQQQKMMMYIMPIFMAFFCFIAPIGVLIYLLTTNFWTMGQQFYVLHNSPLPGSKAHEAHLKRLEEKAAKKAAKRGEPTDAVTSVVSSNGAKGKAGAGKAGATGATGADKAGAVAGTGSVQDARPKQPQRNQPVRTTRSGRKK